MPWKSSRTYSAERAAAREAANSPIARVSITLYSLKPGDSEVGILPSFSGT